MKKWLIDALDSIKWIITAPIIHYLDCRQQNLDGSWDKYHERRNARAERRDRRREIK